MGFLQEAILRAEEDGATVKIDFSEAMTAITTLQARKTFVQYRAARDKLYALAYERPAQLVPNIAGYLDRIEGDRNARARSHMHLTNAVVICYEEIKPEGVADEKERVRLEARRAEALGAISKLARGVPVGHILNLMLIGEKGEMEDALLALGWLDHFQQPEGWVVLKALRMLTEALEKVRNDAGMSAARRTLYLVNGSSAISKLVRIHPDHPYVGNEVVRLLHGLLDHEEEELRYNAGHVLAHIMRGSPSWPAAVDFGVFGKLLANLSDAGSPLGAKGAFDAIEMMMARDPGFDEHRAAHLAWRLAELADSALPHGERAQRILKRLIDSKRAELGRVDACVQGLYAQNAADPERVIRGLARLTDVGVEEVETAAIAAIRLLLDLTARGRAEPLLEETGRLVLGLVELADRKPQEFKNEVELIQNNKAVKKALKGVQRMPGEAKRAEGAQQRPRPKTWNESVFTYCHENPVGEEIQSHLKMTSFDVDSLLKKAADRKVGGLAITVLRDAYRSEYAKQLSARDAKSLAVSILRSLSRHEDLPKVAAARDLFLKLGEDLQEGDRGAIWDVVCDEIGKVLNDPRSEIGPLAMKTLCLLSGPPRENTAIVARIPASIGMDGELAEGRIVRSPKK
jgi:hypothetical protein